MKQNKYQLREKLHVTTLSLVAAYIGQQVGIIPWQLAVSGQSDKFLHYILTAISLVLHEGSQLQRYMYQWYLQHCRSTNLLTKNSCWGGRLPKICEICKNPPLRFFENPGLLHAVHLYVQTYIHTYIQA